MSQADLLSRLPSVQGTYKPHEPLSRHTWFAVGGPAEVMFIPQDEDDLSHFLQQCPSDIPLFTIGGGSNLLIGDLIELQFLGNSYNLNLGSAMSLVLMVIVLLCMSFTSSFDESEMEGVV